MSHIAANTLDATDFSTDFMNDALEQEFGDLHFKVDPKTGMKAIIAIHNTKLGPALGGCRFIEYANTAEAITDVMRLARGMSYKAASVNLPLGGGKSVIIKPAGSFDRQAYFHAFGRFIQELNGRYITALDSGSTLPDMDIIAEHTPYVASLSSDNGNPSPFTAKGVLLGIQTAVKAKLGRDNLSGLHIALQGLGNVGYELALYLHEAGASLTVADVDSEKVERAKKEFGAKSAATDSIHSVSCDVFAPCALGGVINDQTIQQLQTTIIAGSANNQLKKPRHGDELHQKGILYAPDYVINAGGLVFAAAKYFRHSDMAVEAQIEQIPISLQAIFQRSVRDNKPCSVIADQIAQEKLA